MYSSGIIALNLLLEISVLPTRLRDAVVWYGSAYLPGILARKIRVSRNIEYNSFGK
ncbi:MAG: hypothetical protein M1306_03125 [Candidatus Thermoplasmatota archaeon]|nr:hypothetical protein [Candidatus Thermoplasmatota archaeon]